MNTKHEQSVERGPVSGILNPADENASHSGAAKSKGEPNKEELAASRLDFEKLLLRDFPGTYLLYIKLNSQQKESIFLKYQNNGEIEIVREEVIEQVGR